MTTTGEGLRLHQIASVISMLEQGLNGIIQKIVRDSHTSVHLARSDIYRTKAFLVPKHQQRGQHNKSN